MAYRNQKQILILAHTLLSKSITLCIWVLSSVGTEKLTWDLQVRILKAYEALHQLWELQLRERLSLSPSGICPLQVPRVSWLRAWGFFPGILVCCRSSRGLQLESMYNNKIRIMTIINHHGLPRRSCPQSTLAHRHHVMVQANNL